MQAYSAQVVGWGFGLSGHVHPYIGHSINSAVVGWSNWIKKWLAQLIIVGIAGAPNQTVHKMALANKLQENLDWHGVQLVSTVLDCT